jgi:hypothetical protein
MSLGAVFLIIVVIVALIFGVIFFLGFNSDTNRVKVRELSKDLTESERRERIATKALRAIANGAGQPVFEATDALDQIERTYTKELN